MIVKCVTACYDDDGCPNFHFCKVECTREQYEDGLHYEAAERYASREGYVHGMVVFDDSDGPDFLFEHFAWESATILTI